MLIAKEHTRYMKGRKRIQMSKTMKCDIIIPVYNAYECLAECIDSVLKHTDFNEAHLILIDDKSPDAKVLPLLKEYAKKYKDKITLLQNEHNMGFVGTVNKGMKYSKNDVLLLNSDTVVTKNWLKKMRDCAYSDDYVATVTPLSNNATLASVPKIFERNELPKGYNLDEMAELVEKCSMNLYPEIPTAHGFCMYIKRQALEKVGYFDEKNFGKGYGEENDFSFRCFKYGYRHLLCDNTYILHKESQSFLDNKKMHDDELKKIHPMEKKKLDIWNENRDIKIIGKNIELALGEKKERENILIVLHDFDIRNLGGTTMHVMDLIESMRDKYNFHVLYLDGQNYKMHSFYKDTDLLTLVHRKPIVIEDVQFYSLDYERMVRKIIKDYGVSYVHIHHLIGHCFSVIDACKKEKVEYAVTLHDYYLIEAEVAVIEREVGSKENKEIDIDEWRKNSGRLLAEASEVFAPSDYVKDVFEKFFNIKKIKVIEHGVNIERTEKTWDLGDKWNVAFIGVMCPHKGLELMEAMARNASDNLKVHLFGELTSKKRYGKYFVNHGKYDRGELPELIRKNKIDLICILSLWPETYSYTATEAIASGVPIIAFDIGAIGERTKENNLGFVIPYTKDGKEVLGKVQEALADKTAYKEKIKSISEYKVRTVEEMCKYYRDIYNKYVKMKKTDRELLRSDMKLADLLVGNDEFDGNTYRAEYFRILNSRRWKMVAGIRVPEGLRKVVKTLKGRKK